jgi:hypothetical protein
MMNDLNNNKLRTALLQRKAAFKSTTNVTQAETLLYISLGSV